MHVSHLWAPCPRNKRAAKWEEDMVRLVMLTNFKICSNGLNKSVKKLSSGSEKEECCKNGERRKTTYGHSHCQSA